MLAKRKKRKVTHHLQRLPLLSFGLLHQRSLVLAALGSPTPWLPILLRLRVPLLIQRDLPLLPRHLRLLSFLDRTVFSRNLVLRAWRSSSLPSGWVGGSRGGLGSFGRRSIVVVSIVGSLISAEVRSGRRVEEDGCCCESGWGVRREVVVRKEMRWGLVRGVGSLVVGWRWLLLLLPSWYILVVLILVVIVLVVRDLGLAGSGWLPSSSFPRRT